MGMSRDREYGLNKEDLEEFNKVAAIEKRLNDQAEERKRRYDEVLAKREEGDIKGAEEAHVAWQEWEKAYKEDLERTNMGYDTLVSVLNQMWRSLAKFCAALQASSPLAWLIVKIGNVLGDAISDRFSRAMSSIQNSWSTPEADVVPDLQYFVDLNEDNELVTLKDDSLLRSDGKPFSDLQKRQLNFAIKDWVESTQGGRFEMNLEADNTYKIRDMSGFTAAGGAAREVDAAEFREMRDDPSHGLTAYLERKFNLNFEHLSEPPSSSTLTP